MYTDQDQIEKVLQRSLTADEAEILDIVIESVSAAINEHTDRLWFDIGDDGGDAVATSKLYDGNGHREIFIDDFTTITSVQIVDGTGTVVETLDSDYYTAYPLNKSWKNSIYWRAGVFTHGHGNVKVTAIFYTGVLPAEVQLVAATLAGLAFEGSKDHGSFKKESIEGYSYELLTSADITSKQQLLFSSLDKWRKVYV
jgi:hypothetical protein